MAIGLRTQTQGTFAAASTTTVITIPSTVAGDFLLLLIAQAGAGTAVRGVPTDTTNTWVTPAVITAAANGPPAVGLITGTNSSIYECYVLNTVSGITSVTITWAASSKAGVYNLSQWSGTSNTLDAQGGSGAATNTVQTTPSISPADANAVVIGAICSPQSATLLQANSSPTSGWNAMTGGTQSITFSSSYQVMTATGTKNVAYTMGATTPAGFITRAIKAATASSLNNLPLNPLPFMSNGRL